MTDTKPTAADNPKEQPKPRPDEKLPWVETPKELPPDQRVAEMRKSVLEELWAADNGTFPNSSIIAATANAVEMVYALQERIVALEERVRVLEGGKP